MPQRNRIFMKALLPLGLLAVAVLAVFRRKPDEWEYEVVETKAAALEPPAVPDVAGRKPAARFALAAAFTTLFFAGAAFTAGAGDQAVKLMEEDAASLEAEQNLSMPAEDAAAPAEEAAAPEAPAPEAAPEAAPAEPAAPAPAEEPAAEPAPAAPASAPVVAAAPEPSTEAAMAAEPTDEPAATAAPAAPNAAVAPASIRQRPAKAEQPAARPTPAPAASRTPAKKFVVAQAAAAPAPAPEIEHEHGDHATVWLNRVLPDPTPASARLARSFTQQLKATSKRHGADWTIVLGVLRAQGERGAAPATAAELDVLAARLAGKEAWKGALALSGRTAFADQADALADLYRSVGIEALVSGYAKAKDRLAKRLLEREGVLLYAGGREDIEAGRIDVRVLVLIGYLARRHESVTVSSLFSGHRMFARPGVVSAHIYGHAVDVAAVGGTAIFGNSRPGGLTEEAVRSILLLPSELQPRQVISLLGLGGASFPMRDHGDHIHVGF